MNAAFEAKPPDSTFQVNPGQGRAGKNEKVVQERLTRFTRGEQYTMTGPREKFTAVQTVSELAGVQ